MAPPRVSLQRARPAGSSDSFSGAGAAWSALISGGIASEVPEVSFKAEEKVRKIKSLFQLLISVKSGVCVGEHRLPCPLTGLLPGRAAHIHDMTGSLKGRTSKDETTVPNLRAWKEAPTRH